MTREQSKSIESLYLEMFRRMYGVAYAALDDRSYAEEAVQDAFRIACSKPQELLSSKNPQGWLMNTLKYVIMQIRSKRAADAAYIIPLLAEHENLIGRTDENSSDILELLDEEDRRVLILTAVQGKTMLEAARELGISLEACKKRAQRARCKLKTKLIEINERERDYEGL